MEILVIAVRYRFMELQWIEVAIDFKNRPNLEENGSYTFCRSQPFVEGL